MASAAALEVVAPTGALWGLVHDFVMGQQEGPADQVAAGTQTAPRGFRVGADWRERPQHRRRAGRD